MSLLEFRFLKFDQKQLKAAWIYTQVERMRSKTIEHYYSDLGVLTYYSEVVIPNADKNMLPKKLVLLCCLFAVVHCQMKPDTK